jgi:hypothetical protein
VLENLNERFHWIWKHDLGKDVESVESRFEELVAGILEVEGKEGESARL